MNLNLMRSTSRIELRSIIDSDQENIYLGLSHPDVIKYYGISFKTFEATKDQMIWFQHLEKNGTGKWWTIYSSITGQFLGAAGFNDLNKELKKAEIGFWLLPEFWSKGYMQEAMPLICDYGFNELELKRIEGIVESENLNCKRAIEKLGFTLENSSRDSDLKNGKLISLDTYIKLKM